MLFLMLMTSSSLEQDFVALTRKKNMAASGGSSALLNVSMERFILKPKRKFPVLFDLYKLAQSALWTVEEVNLELDRRSCSKLLPNEMKFIKFVLAFFASADGIVNENLAMNFSVEVQVQEARMFYALQSYIESVHVEMYHELLRVFADSDEEVMELTNAFQEIPSVKAKTKWMLDRFDRTKYSFAERLISFACVEGIFFSASFCAIFWLRKRGIAPGLCFSNELISRDEALHCRYACEQYKCLSSSEQISQEKIHEIVQSVTDLEVQYCIEAMPLGLVGLNSDLMSQYVRYVADFWLQYLGVEKLYNVENPFDWMNLISLQGKSNFFEKQESNYAKAHVGSSADDRTFRTTEDF